MPLLVNQIKQVEAYLKIDFTNPQFAGVWMPHRFREKYQSQSKSLAWQYLFPSFKLNTDPETKLIRRHHIDEKQLQRCVTKTARLAKIDKHVTPHTLRH